MGEAISNSAEFNRLTVALLDHLNDAFPIFSILNIETFFEEVDGWALATFEGTMSFLRSEGFINFEMSAEARLYVGVQLTSKGLDLLRSVPTSIEKGSTIGDRFKAAIKTGSTEAFKEAVKLLISQAA